VSDVELELEALEPSGLTGALLELALEAVAISTDALELAERAAAHHDAVMRVVDRLDLQEGPV
jgi:hypothetical protein